MCNLNKKLLKVMDKMITMRGVIVILYLKDTNSSDSYDCR